MASPLPTYEHDDDNYSQTSDADFQSMMEDYSQATAEFGAHSKAQGYIGRTFDNFDTNISVRDEYNRADYDYFRRGEMVPKKAQEVMGMCMTAYEKVAIVRSVIDMMADFTVAGIRIVHPNKKIENFFKNWAKTVGFQFISERISHMLYRTGNCPVKIRWGTVPVRVEDEWRKNYAGKDDIKLKKEKVDKRRIPLGYNILNPLSIEVIGGEMAAFIGKPIYALKISMHMKLMFEKMKRQSITNKDVAEMIEIVPDEMKQAVQGMAPVIPLDQSKIRMLHYKKDDWKVWASPMLESILSNLILLEKMHLADASALDGAISQIRLWTLGIYNPSNPAHSILPKAPAVSKLRNLLSRVGNGVLDLVWGPELTFMESNSQVHNYLKPEKYTQVMQEIFQGLGVPATLTGSNSGGNSGFTNNAISMKTMVERLEYGRKILIDFWEEQFKIIQKAMGWRFPAKVMFDYRVLSDEAAEKAILIDLWDRDIIATETIQELSRRDPELENLRIKKEKAKIKLGTMPDKAGPYHNPQTDHDLRKIILQAGGVTPSEVGLELDERKEGEETKNEQMERMQVEQTDKQMELQRETTKLQLENQEKINKERVKQQQHKPTSPGGDGRPKNSKDTKERKQRTPKPRTAVSEFVDVFMWAQDAQKTIAEIASPALLKHFGKKTLRQLNKEQVNKAEVLKFKILASLEPKCEITPELVYNLLASNLEVDEDIAADLRALSLMFVENNDREPTLEEMRQMQASAYALKHE